jgi:hypothetical protein
LVRGAAVWALKQHLPDTDFAGRRERLLASEHDPAVIVEWG